MSSAALYPWMSAEGNLRTLATEATRADRKAILRRLHLESTKPVRVYSQGMRQRAAIAVAVLNGTKTLVLDEPTNGLDPAAIRDFQSLHEEQQNRAEGAG